ncbi:M3 family oligoendopeptidase [Elusimicrobiota bacterium]
MKDKNATRWNLEDIYQKTARKKIFEELTGSIKIINSYYSKMAPEMPEKVFLSFISYYEASAEKLSRLIYKPYLQKETDQKSSEALRQKHLALGLHMKLTESSRKTWQWVMGKEVPGKKKLDNLNAKRLFKNAGEMKYILQRKRAKAVYALNEREENIIDNKDLTGNEVLTSLRTLIETEMEFFFKPRGVRKGRKIQSIAELTKYVFWEKTEFRKEAYLKLLTGFRKNIDKYFLIYHAVVKDWVYERKLRGYKEPISIRNESNNISDEAVQALLSVCREKKEIYQDFFRIKAKMLNMKKLNRHDIYAPVITAGEKKISYQDSLKLVMDVFGSFSSGFSERAGKIIDSRHIDVFPDKKKVSGAFCATVSPEVVPYILLNHTGKYRDVLTLAHELGHGIHSLYCTDLSYSAQGSSLPLAETASTFCEMLVFEQMYARASGRKEKIDLLVSKLSDSYATVLRQNYFIKFEQEVHKKINSGITAESVSDIYFRILTEQFGESVSVDPLFRYEWAYIPHIVHTPFYCYAYSFGELLSLSLYYQYKTKGKVFIHTIIKILKTGGSKDPVKTLKKAGIDVSKKKFWRDGFKIIENWKDELVELI